MLTDKNKGKKTSESLPEEASLGKRYGIKLASNIATIPLFFLLESILPRILGPALYGQYNFTFAFFSQVSNFFDPGVSACSRTYIAKKPQEKGRIFFFLKVFLFIAIAYMLFSTNLLFPSLRAVFLPEIPPWLIIPVAFLCVCMWLAGVIRGLNDALGVTHISEIVRIIVNLSAALLILFLFLKSLLSFDTFLTIQIISYVTLAFGFLWVFKSEWSKRHKASYDKNSLSSEAQKTYRKDFIDYCRPLLVLSAATAIAAVSERWILQFFGGSMAQGYFSLSQKISMGCYLFVSAMIPLLMREMALAHEKNDPKALARIIDRFAPLLYSIVAWFCCFTAVEARGVVRIFGGEAFAEALLPVQIMVFFPLHHAYWQLCASIFYSTNKTGTLRTVVIFSLIFGLIVSWFFIAPAEYFGLGLSSVGLALKMVLVQALTVIVLLLVCKKTIPFSLKKNLSHQLLAPIFFIAIAFAAQKTTGLFSTDLFSIQRFLISGLIYTSYSCIAVFSLPAAIGFNRSDLNYQLKRTLNYAFRILRR